MPKKEYLDTAVIHSLCYGEQKMIWRRYAHRRWKNEKNDDFTWFAFILEHQHITSPDQILQPDEQFNARGG